MLKINTYRVYLFLCLLPIWVLSKNIILIDKIIFSLPYIIIYLFLFFFLKKDFLFTKFETFIISIITVFALDQNILFNLSFVKPYFGLLNDFFPNVYYADFLIIIFFLFFLLFLFFILKTKL